MYGAAVQVEGSVQPRLAPAMLLIMRLREAVFWWLLFIMCKMGMIITTYVTGVLQDLIN